MLRSNLLFQLFLLFAIQCAILVDVFRRLTVSRVQGHTDSTLRLSLVSQALTHTHVSLLCFVRGSPDTDGRLLRGSTLYLCIAPDFIFQFDVLNPIIGYLIIVPDLRERFRIDQTTSVLPASHRDRAIDVL